jgi:lysyl-tRNA synthetase class II
MDEQQLLLLRYARQADKYHGLTNVEQRYRQRYLDLISNKESFDRFMKRSLLLRYARQAFLLRHSHCHLDNDGFR